MNLLVKKEIRLLLPAWITAMLLVFAPIPLGLMLEGNGLTDATVIRMSFAVAIGSVVLGLTGFGREVSSRTFSLLLAQPRPRRELWRAKMYVLLAGLIPFGLFLVFFHQEFLPRAAHFADARQTTALIWFLTVCAAVTGGLWTTLLFRQLISAFWISIVVPFAIFALAMQPEDENTRGTLATVLLLVYSAAGYWFARWQFLRAQDTAWTGGNISLPGFTQWLPWISTSSAQKKAHPLLALFGKELQFQQINFLLGGLLFLLQLAVLAAQHLIQSEERTTLQMIFDSFWGIWIVMPLLVGSGAVAEERKLGMLETQLCLPISRGWQFVVKVLVTLFCGTLLGGLVPAGLALTHQIGPGQLDHGFLVGWPLACAGLTLLGFYASSLTSQLLQAFGAAVGIALVALLSVTWFTGNFSGPDGEVSCLGYQLWRGPLVLLTGAGVLLLAAMVLSWRRLRWAWTCFLVLVALSLVWCNTQPPSWFLLAMQSEVFGVKTVVLASLALALSPVLLTLALAARNAPHPQVSPSLWWRNLAVWTGCLLLTGVMTTLVYHRAWELFLRFEPPAGVARLSGKVQPVISGLMPGRLTLVLLPDGRLCDYTGYQASAIILTNQTANANTVWLPVVSPQINFLGQSNWTTIATTAREAVGVRSDGSMWSTAFFEQVENTGSVLPLPTGAATRKGASRRATALEFRQVQGDAAWKAVAASWTHCVALRQDGTIWGWGHNGNGQLGAGPAAFTNGPVRIGGDSNWVSIFATPGHTFAVNRAGDIWKWGAFATDLAGKQIEKGPVTLNIRVAGVRGIESQNGCDLILDTEGKLWGLGRIPSALIRDAASDRIYATATRLNGDHWSAISFDWQEIVGLKQDGTIWRQTCGPPDGPGFKPATQLGQRTDWIAVTKEWDAVLALGRDGTICRFGNAWQSELQLLAPTRRVTWSLDLLQAAQ